MPREAQQTLLADFKFNCIQLIKGVGEKKENYLNSVVTALGLECEGYGWM